MLTEDIDAWEAGLMALTAIFVTERRMEQRANKNDDKQLNVEHLLFTKNMSHPRQHNHLQQF